jgi:hypothetical protein
MIRMHGSIRWFAAGAAAVFLSVCGGCGSAPITPPVAAPAAIDGRWGFESTITVPVGTPLPAPFPTLVFSGVLHNNAGIVDGVGQAYFIQSGVGSSVSCFQPAAVTVHGSFSSARHLTLTSEQVSGTVFTLDLDVPATLGSPMTGTGSATGTCPVPAGSTADTFSNSLTGSYAGTMSGVTQVGTGTTPVKELVTAMGAMTLNETDPDPATGQSTITGTATLTFPSCSVTLPVNTTRIGARNSAIQLFPGTSPVVGVDTTQGNAANLFVFYLDSTCKTQPAITPLNFTEWAGVLPRQ